VFIHKRIPVHVLKYILIQTLKPPLLWKSSLNFGSVPILANKPVDMLNNLTLAQESHFENTIFLNY
jgi:hypothetical protein